MPSDFFLRGRSRPRNREKVLRSSGSAMARGPQPGLVRFGPVSSAGPGPVWSPQSGSLDPLPSAGPGSVPSAHFCPFGPVLSPPLAGPSPLSPVLSPWPSSVLSARFCHLGLAPSARFCLLSPVLSPQSAPFSPARLRPFGLFLSLSLSLPSGRSRFLQPGSVPLARFSWPGSFSSARRAVQPQGRHPAPRIPGIPPGAAGSCRPEPPNPTPPAGTPGNNKPPPPKKGELPAPPNHGGPRHPSKPRNGRTGGGHKRRLYPCPRITMEPFARFQVPSSSSSLMPSQEERLSVLWM